MKCEIECQNRCQIECQIKCRNICQNLSQSQIQLVWITRRKTNWATSNWPPGSASKSKTCIEQTIFMILSILCIYIYTYIYIYIYIYVYLFFGCCIHVFSTHLPLRLPRRRWWCYSSSLAAARGDIFGDLSLSQMLHVWNIYLQNWYIFGVNIGKYSIHGASGYGYLSQYFRTRQLDQVGSIGCDMFQAARETTGPKTSRRYRLQKTRG